MDFYNQELKKFEKELGKDSTGLSELTRVGKQTFGKKYIGTFASDEKIHLKNGQCCIVNTLPLGTPGEHWVAVAFNGGCYILYDSFGRDNNEMEIENLDGLRICLTEQDPEQHESENNCGQRCLAWLSVFFKLGEAAALTI